MAIRERARLFCLFATGTVVCAAQQGQRTTAMQWVDHYSAVYQVPRELVHSIIGHTRTIVELSSYMPVGPRPVFLAYRKNTRIDYSAVTVVSAEPERRHRFSA